MRYGIWSSMDAISDYHNKHGLRYQHKECTHTYEDGSQLTLNIETREKDKDFYCPLDKEWYTESVLTKTFIIREWAFEEKRFRTIEAAERYIHAECERTGRR